MNTNIKYFVVFFILLAGCISVTHATNDTSSSSDMTKELSSTEVNKVITKQQKNYSLKEVTNEVRNYSSLIAKLDDNETKKTINLKKTTYDVTTPVTMKYRNISKNVVINGNGAVIDGQGSKSFLTIAPNHKVVINDLTIINTKGKTQSGAIVVSSNSSLIMNNCTFINDISTGKGGALTNRGKTVINNSLFISNTAMHGGAIWSTGEHGGSLKIENSRFISNKASYNNDYERTAVVYLVTGGIVNIINNTFENNDGGSIHNFGTNLLVKQNVFKNITLDVSKTTIRGAVIDNYEAPISVIGNTFENIELYVDSIRGGILYNEIGESYFNDNKVSNLEIMAMATGDSLNGGILFNRNSTLTVSNNIFNNVNYGYRVHGGALYNNIGILNVSNNVFNTTNIATREMRGGAIYNDKDKDLVGILYYGLNNYENVKNYGPINNEFIYNIGIATDYSIKATVITVNTTYGVIGNQITLTANVRDSKGNAVTGGNLVFKINGKTLKKDGTFNSSAESYKVSVVDGMAKATLIATKDIREAKNVSATYSGSKKYYANTTSSIATTEISLRKASINVMVSQNTPKHYDTIRFTAKVVDLSGDTKSSIPLNEDDSYVFFKINGVTLKDSDGNQIKVKLKDGIATYDYVVPAGMSAIGKDKKIRYYNVTAGYVNPYYYPDTKNSTRFNVLKSNVTIQTSKIVFNMTNHKLSVKGYIKDYKNNNLIGTNKLSLKINGKTIQINGKTTTNVIDGLITLTLKISSAINNIKSIELVTGARTAYEGSRTTITSYNKYS